jgi:hypothetical protein
VRVVGPSSLYVVHTDSPSRPRSSQPHDARHDPRVTCQHLRAPPTPPVRDRPASPGAQSRGRDAARGPPRQCSGPPTSRRLLGTTDIDRRSSGPHLARTPPPRPPDLVKQQAHESCCALLFLHTHSNHHTSNLASPDSRNIKHDPPCTLRYNPHPSEPPGSSRSTTYFETFRVIAHGVSFATIPAARCHCQTLECRPIKPQAQS